LKKLIPLFILLLLALCLVQAEDVVLKDGTKISGTITAVSAEKFQIKTAYGEIQVPRTDIVSISFPENAPKKDAAAIPVIDQTINGRKYINKTEGFEITAPGGWVIAPEMVSHDIHGALKSEDETLFFMYTPEKFGGTLNSYIALAETDFSTRFKDFEKLSQTEVTLDGHKTTRVLWHGKNTAVRNTPIKALVYFIPMDGKMVRLSFLTVEALFDDNLPIFEKMAASYHGAAAK
jgi:hypothetical protein